MRPQPSSRLLPVAAALFDRGRVVSVHVVRHEAAALLLCKADRVRIIVVLWGREEEQVLVPQAQQQVHVVRYLSGAAVMQRARKPSYAVGRDVAETCLGSLRPSSAARLVVPTRSVLR